MKDSTPSAPVFAAISPTNPDFDLLVVIKHRTPEKVDTIVGIIVEIEMKNNLSFFL